MSNPLDDWLAGATPEKFIGFVCTHDPGSDRPPTFLDPYAAGTRPNQRAIDDARERRPEHGDFLAEGRKAHQRLQCPACGWEERLGPDKIAALAEWASEHDVERVPLRSARRILTLLGK